MNIKEVSDGVAVGAIIFVVVLLIIHLTWVARTKQPIDKHWVVQLLILTLAALLVLKLP